jgi:hypothetical protein
MTIIKSILRRSGLPVRGEAAAREIEDELQFHLEMRARDNIAAGMSPEYAVADAMRRFGDFDHIRTTCEQIRRERRTAFMKLAKALLWIVQGCGLTLQLVSKLATMVLVGQFLTVIAMLWIVLIHMRERRPDQRRIMAAEQLALSVTHTVSDFSVSDFAEELPKGIPSYDGDGRTPVERLRSDESPSDTPE